MSQEVHNTSPPDSGRSQISRDGSPSVALGIPISGIENPSLQSTPGSLLSPPSPRASEEERIRMSIESKEKEVKEKQTEIKETRKNQTVFVGSWKILTQVSQRLKKLS
jgi:hypothetical protein